MTRLLQRWQSNIHRLLVIPPSPLWRIVRAVLVESIAWAMSYYPFSSLNPSDFRITSASDLFDAVLAEVNRILDFVDAERERAKGVNDGATNR